MEVVDRLKQMPSWLGHGGGIMLTLCMYKLNVIVSGHMEKSG